MQQLALEILRHLYELDPKRLDSALTKIDQANWSHMISLLEFSPWDTGGGCMMLLASLPDNPDYRLGITDGNEGLPINISSFWVGILQEDNSEIYSAFVANGQIVDT